MVWDGDQNPKNQNQWMVYGCIRYGWDLGSMDSYWMLLVYGWFMVIGKNHDYGMVGGMVYGIYGLHLPKLSKLGMIGSQKKRLALWH